MVGRKLILLALVLFLCGCVDSTEPGEGYSIDTVRTWMQEVPLTAETVDTLVCFQEQAYYYADTDGSVLSQGSTLMAVFADGYFSDADGFYVDIEVQYTMHTEDLDEDGNGINEDAYEGSGHKTLAVGIENANIVMETENYGKTKDSDDTGHQLTRHTFATIESLTILNWNGHIYSWQIPEDAWRDDNGQRYISVYGEGFTGMLYENGLMKRTDDSGETKSILETNRMWNLNWLETGVYQ